MTPHGKANHHTHYSTPVFSCARWGGDGTTTYAQWTLVFRRTGEFSIPRCTLLRRAIQSVFRNGTRKTSPFDAFQPLRDTRADSAQRFAGALRVQSRLLRCVGACSWQANQSCAVARRPVRTSEQLFRETLGAKIIPSSAALSWRSGRTSPRSTWRSGQGYQSAARNISSTANASRTPRQRLRSMPRSSVEGGV